MRKLTGWVMAVAILGLSAGMLRADDKMVPEDGAFEVMLLRQQSVQQELKLQSGDAAKIDKFTADQWQKAKEINKLSEAERDRKFQELSKENDRFIDQTLSKEQRKRLKEVELQVAGLLCVTRDEVARKLNLTEDQKKRAHQMQKEARQEMQELVASYKADEKSNKLEQLHKTSNDKLKELLTDEQEKIWAQMTGAPFNGEFRFGSKKTTAS